MLDELNTYEDKLKRPEAVAADPEPLKRQIKKVRNLQDHVDNQMETVEALRKAGNEMISAAPPGDPHAKGNNIIINEVICVDPHVKG